MCHKEGHDLVLLRKDPLEKESSLANIVFGEQTIQLQLKSGVKQRDSGGRKRQTYREGVEKSHLAATTLLVS